MKAKSEKLISNLLLLTVLSQLLFFLKIQSLSPKYSLIFMMCFIRQQVIFDRFLCPYQFMTIKYKYGQNIFQLVINCKFSNGIVIITNKKPKNLLIKQKKKKKWMFFFFNTKWLYKKKFQEELFQQLKMTKVCRGKCLCKMRTEFIFSINSNSRSYKKEIL